MGPLDFVAAFAMAVLALTAVVFLTALFLGKD